MDDTNCVCTVIVWMTQIVCTVIVWMTQIVCTVIVWMTQNVSLGAPISLVIGGSGHRHLCQHIRRFEALFTICKCTALQYVHTGHVQHKFSTHLQLGEQDACHVYHQRRQLAVGAGQCGQQLACDLQVCVCVHVRVCVQVCVCTCVYALVRTCL